MLSSARGACLTKLLRQQYGADPRSLALFRIALATVVIYDLRERATDATVFYTDRGAFPRAVSMDDLPSPGKTSLHFANGHLWFQLTLFGVAACFAFQMLVGWKTRRAVIFTWLHTISLHNRNEVLLTGGDCLLRALLFWSMFCPLGAYFSFDAHVASLAATSPSKGRHVGGCPLQELCAGVVALRVQAALLYWASAMHKTAPEWHEQQSAIYFALNIDGYTLPLGRWLLQFPATMQCLTQASLALEFWGGLLLLLPSPRGLLRLLLSASFIGFHLGIALAMRLGVMTFICVVGNLHYLPSFFWDQKSMPSTLVARWLLVARARPIGQALCAILRANRYLSAGACSLHLPHTDDKNQAGRQYPQRPRRRKFQEVVVATMLVYTVNGNMLLVNKSRRRAHLPPLLPAVLDRPLPGQEALLRSLGLDQAWDMFAPAPMKDDGWWVIPGTLRDSSQVDVFRYGACSGRRPARNARSASTGLKSVSLLSYEKPEWIWQDYRSTRWHKYMRSLWAARNGDHRRLLHFARYLCKQWNGPGKVMASAGSPGELLTFEIIMMLEYTLPDYKLAHPTRVVLWKHSCLDPP